MQIEYGGGGGYVTQTDSSTMMPYCQGAKIRLRSGFAWIRVIDKTCIGATTTTTVGSGHENDRNAGSGVGITCDAMDVPAQCQLSGWATHWHTVL